MSFKIFGDKFFEKLWGFGWGDFDFLFKDFLGCVCECWYCQVLCNLCILMVSKFVVVGGKDNVVVEYCFFGLQVLECEVFLVKIVFDSWWKDQRILRDKVLVLLVKKEEGGGE